MMPFLFGSRERRLFGAYDPAQPTNGADRAVLICPPWGNEYIFAHRTLRHLALRLSQKGFHVLRFDYYATGDSAGEDGENDYAGSYADLQMARTELKEMTGVAQINFVGMRFGASLAAEATARQPREVASLVMWDPLIKQLSEAAELADIPKNFSTFDFSEHASSLPARSLLLLTSGQKLDVTEPLSTSFAPCKPPWFEQNAQSGTIPRDAIQHVINWLE